MDNGADSYRRFLTGDDDSFVEIIKEYKDGLTYYLVSFVGDMDVAEELTEDTFVRIVTKKPRFSAKSSFKTWLFAIGRHIALDHIRHNAKNRAALIDDAARSVGALPDPADAFLTQERKRHVHRALRRLKSEYQQILWLVYFEGFSVKEAAKIMKKTAHGAETLVYRARLALKSILEQEGFGDEDI